MGGLGFGDQKEPRRVFVEAVNDAGPGWVADSCEPGQIRQECVGEGACLVSGTGMGREAGLLVDGQKVFVFVDYVQDDGTREWGWGWVGGGVYFKGVVWSQLLAGFSRSSVYPDLARGDHLLYGGAREFGAESSEIFVQSLVRKDGVLAVVMGESHL